MLGLTFKENCPDIRNSQMIDLCNMMAKKRIKVYGYDPFIAPTENKSRIFNKVKLLDKFPKLGSKFNIIIIGVKHDEFKDLKIQNLLKLKKNNSFIVDLKNLIPKKYSEFTL